MFACESILKNGSIATLELYNNQPRWWIKDAILTDRAFYQFQEKGDLLGDEYDKLEMAQFRSYKVQQNEDSHNVPPYVRQLPPFKQPYNNIIEMINKKTQKRRVLACESPVVAEEYVNLMNLVNSYLNYELMFKTEASVQDQSSVQSKDKDSKKQNQGSSKEQQPQQSQNLSGPVFITTWVQTYTQHQGLMEFKEEAFSNENFPYLLSFGRENDAIKTLVFNENFLFAGNEQRALYYIQQVLSTFSRDSVTQLVLRGNFLSDQVLKQVIPSISQYEKLTILEISNNGLQNQSLETLGVVFQNCPFINKVNLSSNLLGQGPNQAQALDAFLTHLMTELDQPQVLDLSDNKFTDESLAPFIKYIFANEDCKLQLFSLESCSSFSSYGKRTLLKAYSLCQNKQSLQFKCGPVPFTEATLKHAFNVQYETKTIAQGKGKEPEIQKVLKSMNRDKLELRITRKPNYGAQYLRGLPVSKVDREKLNSVFAKIESFVHNRNQVFIEDIRDLLAQISQLHFEFPRHRLEPIFDIVNEKLYQSIENENVYCLEVLLDCLRYMNARNPKAEEKYQELSIVAAGIARDIIKVINMELLDDNILNKMLDNALVEAKKIGMRGEILDVAITLKMLRNNFLTEMQNKSANSDDEGDKGLGGTGEDQHQLEFYDEDKTMNVYDEKYDCYIDMSAEELGLTSEVEPNLGVHPYSADYLKISNLNLHYVKKNLKEAQKFLRDEESYSYRNIFDRCYFLLCDSNETTLQSKAYNLAKNDQNLKMARLVFRYRNNLDALFPQKLEPSTMVMRTVNESRRKSVLSGKSDDYLQKLYSYKFLLAKEYIEFNGTKLTHPVTKIDKNKAPIAVVFNRNLFAICESDDLNKNALYLKIQELHEEFIVKNGALINEDLYDEFYLQLFRQINRKNMQQSEKSAKAIANALFVMALFSRYGNPCNELQDSLESWLAVLRDKTGAEFFRLIQQILQNFQIIKKLDANTKPYVNWAPCFAEIESVITGEEIQIQVYTPTGDVFQYPVDSTTTIHSLLTNNIYKEKFFAKEPDQDLYWLYQHVEKADQFDQPLSKDKRVLKVIYKNEKEQRNRDSQNLDNDGSRRFSFIKKKSTKFMRKQTIFASMDALADNEFQNTIFLVRKRIFTSLHCDKNVKTLAKKALNFLYHQVRMDYIEKNLLRRLSNYEDVSAFAALILKCKYWGKILRSKDNSLTRELIIKNIEYAIPASFLREKNQEYWVQKIQRDFDRHNLRELSIEEAQEKFLNLFATYHLSYSSYFVVKAQPNSTENMLKQLELDDSDDMPTLNSPQKQTSGFIKDSFLSQHLNHDLLCVINFTNGISFYENTKRDKIIAKIQFDEILYVMGSGDVLKLGYINKNQVKNMDIKLELYTTNGQSARPISEDIISYCQVRLAECSKNEAIEIVKRNIINIFEDMEDPYLAMGDDDSQTSPRMQSSGLFKKHTTIGMNDKARKSTIGAFEFLIDQQEMSQGGSPGPGDFQAASKSAQMKILQQRGHQFRMREKFIIYLKKYPVYMQKVQGTPDSRQTDTSQKSSTLSQINSRSSSSSIGNLNAKGDRSSMFNKLQLATQRIEEDKEEDEDDSSSQYLTNDEMKDQTKRSESSRSNNGNKVVKNTSPLSSQQNMNLGNSTQKSPIGSSSRDSSFNKMNGQNSRNQQQNSFMSRQSDQSSSKSPVKQKVSSDEVNAGLNTQQNVLNELFSSKAKPTGHALVSPLDLRKVGIDTSSPNKDDSRDLGQPEGEAMVLGQKVNYNEMDKTQKKENLNNILQAAFNVMPPPPPPRF